MNTWAKQKSKGFTIVELLIVIVVIAILATITIVAYNGIQVRARDSIRSTTVSSIKKSLELYKADKGQYPVHTPNPGSNGIEVSSDTKGTFMEYLSNYGYPNGSPVDPINSGNYQYWYIRYPAGSGGCSASKGGFYIIWVAYENPATRPVGNTFPASCTSPPADASDVGGVWYTYSSFEN